jgi:hypothetical protein
MTNDKGLVNQGSGSTFSSITPVVSSLGTTVATLSSTGGATNAPFTFGLPLREGAFPQSSSVTFSGVSNYQVDIRNRWPDNSAKFAIISGRTTISAASQISLVASSGASPTGSALTEANLLSSGVEATLQFAGGTTMTLSALIGVAATSNASGITQGGRVRQLTSGPQMSSWLYASSLSATNPHIVGWMEVRYYGGTDVHVLPWVENGFTRISGCAGQAGTLTFTLGGTTRFTQANVHLANHCRVVAQDTTGAGYWLNTLPDVYARPDSGYMQSTKMVPGYFPDTTGATTQLNALSQTYSPVNYGQLTTSPRDGGGNATSCGDFGTGMANAGYHLGIGLLSGWDAFYLTSNTDKRAWNSIIANAMGYGRYGVHVRDELTLRPVNPSDVPNKTLGTGHNVADRGANQYGAPEILPDAANYDPTGLNLKPEYWAQTHHPSAGFLAYLVTGHEFFLELAQFVAGMCFLRQNNVHRNYGDGLQLTQNETVRGQAWAVRTIFKAAAISVDGSALKTGFSAIAANNVNSYHLAYIGGPLGVCGSFGVPRNYGNFRPDTNSYRVNAFEYDFSVGAWGYGLDLKPVTGATLTKMREYATWHAKWPVSRLGALGDATTFGFNCAARANFIAVAPGNSGSQWDTNTGWYNNPGEMFAETPGGSNATNTTNTIGAYVGDDASAGYFPDATSYWGNIQIPLLYAVELGVVGAMDAYRRMVGASNWGTLEANFVTSPGYGHRPRNVMAWGTSSVTGSLVGDVWTPGKDAQGRINKASYATIPTGRWIEVAGTRIDQQLTTTITGASIGWSTSYQLWGGGSQSSLFQSWSGFTPDSDAARFWFFGGGHSDGFNNGLYRFDCSLMTWSVENLPSNRSLMSNTYLNGGSATNDPDSTALATANFNANNIAGTTTGILIPATNGSFYDEISFDVMKPTARHSYQGMVYTPLIGAAGSIFMHARRLWRYDIALGQWVFKRLINDQVRANPGTIAAPNATGLIEIHAAEAALAIYDEVANKVLVSASGSAGGGAFAYNWNTQTWASWTASYGLNYNDAAHVRVGRTSVAFRLPRADAPVVYPGIVWVYNIDTNSIQRIDVQFGGGLDISVFTHAFYDGTSMVYVPTINRYWICTRISSGMTWLTLDPTTSPWTLSPLTFANAQPVQEILIQGRTLWIPDMNAVLIWDHCFANAFIYKF